MSLRASITSEVNSASASDPVLMLEGLFSTKIGNLSLIKKGQWSDSLCFSIEMMDSSSFSGRKTRSMMDGIHQLEMGLTS